MKIWPIFISMTSAIAIERQEMTPPLVWHKAVPGHSLRDNVGEIAHEGGQIIGSVVEIVSGSDIVSNWVAQIDEAKPNQIGYHRLAYREHQLMMRLERPLSFQDGKLLSHYLVELGDNVGKSTGRIIGGTSGGVVGGLFGVGVAIPTLGLGAPLVIPARLCGTFIGGAIGHVVGKKVGYLSARGLHRVVLMVHRKGFRSKQSGITKALEDRAQAQHLIFTPLRWVSRDVSHPFEKVFYFLTKKPSRNVGSFLGKYCLKVTRLPFDEEIKQQDHIIYEHYQNHNAYLHKLAKQHK